MKGKGWRWRTILAAAALLLSAGCGENIHRRQSYVFGTLVEITVHGED